jgi:hypothetical protein
MHRWWCLEHHPRCTAAGCEQLAQARGLCSAHYQQWYAHGSRKALCSIKGCGHNSHARGLCLMHLKRFYRKREDSK